MHDLQSDRRHIPTRLLAATLAAATVVTALGIRAAAAGDVAKYAGDALYTVLLYALVVLLAPRVRPLIAAAIAWGISWAVEFAQLSGVPAELSERSTAARLVLGSTFNAPDLLWYAVGAAAAWIAHASLTGQLRKRNFGRRVDPAASRSSRK